MTSSVLPHLRIHTRSGGTPWKKRQRAGEMVAANYTNRFARLCVSKKGPPSIAFLAHNRVCVYDCARFGV